MSAKPDIAVLYAVRRKSDDWYFKKTKPPKFSSQRKAGDPRLTHWTPTASEATFYTLQGAKAIWSQYRGKSHREHVRLLKQHNPASTKDKPSVPEDYEIVRFVCTEQPEVVV